MASLNNIERDIIPGVFSFGLLIPILDSPKVSVSILLIVILVASVSLTIKEVVIGVSILKVLGSCGETTPY